MGVQIKQDHLKSVLASMRRLDAKQVLVGVPAANADRQPEPGEPAQPATNALIGYVMETGSPLQNIPARPHLVPGVESVREQVAARYEAGGKAILDGRISDLDPVHTAVGLIAEAAVRKKITNGPFVPLSPRTLAAREARGRTGTKPLIDTGQYRRSITHVIRPKGT